MSREVSCEVEWEADKKTGRSGYSDLSWVHGGELLWEVGGAVWSSVALFALADLGLPLDETVVVVGEGRQLALAVGVV